DERRQDRVAVLFENVGLAVADDGHFAVRGAEINADDGFAHGASRLGKEVALRTGDAHLGVPEHPAAPQVTGAHDFENFPRRPAAPRPARPRAAGGTPPTGSARAPPPAATARARRPGPPAS